ncbi:hypothetical protein BGZ99_005300 [Dissophora globulifera]|uniref:PQ-loop-domain-containing protein n=1 Tax=Dissophora globulifera TaxID=979702 RepID=A0A9P6RSX8_9FUNG|nr:hypothetical protein BGZ99_005300 [Dissophora globulifera]
MAAHTVLYWLASQSATGAAALAEDGGVPMKIYLSNIAGSLSILCWFIVFTPQFWINYKRQSGESLSLVFLYIWLAGDIMNLIGATMENLLLTMRVLAWYYTVADIALIGQIFYYRRTSVKASFESVITHANSELLNVPHEHRGEHAPLISGSGSASANYAAISSSEHVHENAHDRVIHEAAMVANATASHYAEDHHGHHIAAGEEGAAHAGARPRHQRRPSAHSTHTTSSGRRRSTAARRRKMVRNVLMVVLPIVLVLIFVWAYYDWLQCTIGNGDDTERGPHCGRGHGRGKLPPSPDTDMDNEISLMMSGDSDAPRKHPGDDDGHDGEKSGYRLWLPLLMGWGSAILYLGSRIPQIYKNWRLKSCEGLSVMMFVFSVLGNVFYVASIFLNSLEIDYLIRNMPWWLGSGGTLIFDFTIFFQFYIYRFNSPLSEALKEAAASGELDQNALMATAEDDDSMEEETDTDSSSSGTLLQQNKNNSQHRPTDSEQTRV